MISVITSQSNPLFQEAKKASLKSYSPYSKFKVGVALEDINGNIFTGCNVENLAFPSGICAEQTAISKVISEVGPNMRIKTLLVYTPTTKVTTPCGSCRQVINEFALQNTEVICMCDSEESLHVRFSELLPKSTIIDNLK